MIAHAPAGLLIAEQAAARRETDVGARERGGVGLDDIEVKKPTQGMEILDAAHLPLHAARLGTPAPLPFGDKVVGVVMNRNGEVMDVIKNIKD